VTNLIGNPVNLDTFHAPTDWHISTDQKALDAIWDHPRSYRRPFTLKPPKITNNNANAVLERTVLILKKMAFEASWFIVLAKVFICGPFMV
jgi:hypothetical protein